MNDLRKKPDRRWVLKGRLIILPGVTLIFGGLGLDIFGGDLGWIGRLMFPLGLQSLGQESRNCAMIGRTTFEANPNAHD